MELGISSHFIRYCIVINKFNKGKVTKKTGEGSHKSCTWPIKMKIKPLEMQNNAKNIGFLF